MKLVVCLLFCLRLVADGGFCFDGTKVEADSEFGYSSTEFTKAAPRFYIRDIVSDSDWVCFEPVKEGHYSVSLSSERDFSITLSSKARKDGVTLDDIKISSASASDRCVTLIVAFPVNSEMTYYFKGLDYVGQMWGDEIVFAIPSQAGSKRLGREPVQGVGNSIEEVFIGLDPDYPAFYRTFYNIITHELCFAYDLGFVKGNTEWKLRSCRYSQTPGSGMRVAWERYAKIYPDAFVVRTPIMGNWMHNAPIGGVKDFQDFGFAFKTGNLTTEWDDINNMLSFRYTEPLTWWMPFEPSAKESAAANRINVDDAGVTIGGQTDDAAILELGAAEARRLASGGDARAMTWERSVMYDASGKPAGKWLDTPWCKGIVWSMSELPGIDRKEGDPTSSFGYKWNEIYRNDLYPIDEKASRPVPSMWIDGEYTDSSEGYITIEMDYRREHLERAAVPLTFSLDEKVPVVFKGLTSFEYVRGIADDTHAAGRLMFANATPLYYSWLAPMLDVMGTETDWRWTGDWHPFEMEELQYKRMLCYGKPFCFIQNTEFSKFTFEMIEKYIKRCLAFGMFPGFFSADAYNGHFFMDPSLYEPVRPLFKKYMPMIIKLANAGWEPVTKVSVNNPGLYVERFGNPYEETCYITVYNPGPDTLEIEFTDIDPSFFLSPTPILGATSLGPEEVSVFELKPVR